MLTITLDLAHAPPSWNNKTKQKQRTLDRFSERLKQQFQTTYPPHRPLADLLSGDIIWLTNKYEPGKHPDADNISKPVWDALSGLAYEDDKQIRRRSSGIIELTPGTLTELNFSTWPPVVVDTVEQVSMQPVFNLLVLHLCPLTLTHFQFNQ